MAADSMRQDEAGISVITHFSGNSFFKERGYLAFADVPSIMMSRRKFNPVK
jgi:hypothetical protein